jgi:hypothetical protein
MKFETSEVYSLKIANGDELIARVIAVDDTSITVAAPLTVVPSRDGIQLVPSLFTTELNSDVTININNIVMIAAVRDQVRDSYTEATTGIKPVRSQILTG